MTRADMHHFTAEQVKPEVAFFEQLIIERAKPNSHAGLLPEAHQIDITPRRLRTKTFDGIVWIGKSPDQGLGRKR